MNRHKDAPCLRLSNPSRRSGPAAAIVYRERDAVVKAPKSGSFRAFRAWPALSGGRIGQRGRAFDRLNVGVREAEMMADLMNQNVCDDRAERILAVAPEVEQRPTIEPYHVGQLARLLDRGALCEPTAAKQAQKVKFALGAHLIERLVIREVHHLDDQTLAEALKRGGQPGERRPGKPID